jgi:hypothetical protein
MESILPPEILAETKPTTKAAYTEMTEYVVLFQCGGKYGRQRILIYKTFIYIQVCTYTSTG